jgi:hypothetical protein
MKIMNIINKIKNSKKLQAVIVIKLLVKIIFIFSVLLNTSCGEKALLWELSTDRMEVLMKGTYESEPGYIWPWNFPLVNDPLLEDDSVNYKASNYAVINTNDTVPTQFMFDIAEMRIVDTEGTELKFANFRQTYTVGLNNTDPFFTSGILLQTDDVTPGKTYTSIKIYLRKTVFNNATQYTSSDGGSSWNYVSTTSTMFAESTVNGYDFTSLMMNTYWDTLRMEALYVNRIFPLEIPISGGLNFSLADGRTILEVRLLIKNFIKKYETVTYPDGVMTLTHFWGFSDHLRRVHANESYYGGNLLGVARSYVPASARTLRINGVASDGFIILVPSATSTDYVIATATDLRTTNVPNCDFPKPPQNPGNYIGPLMDYYLKYEKYKIDYSGVYTTCTPITNFQTEWDAYNSAVSSFKMPTAAAYTISGSNPNYIRNIKPGFYYVYKSTSAPTYGMVFNQALTPTTTASVDLTSGDGIITY